MAKSPNSTSACIALTAAALARIAVASPSTTNPSALEEITVYATPLTERHVNAGEPNSITLTKRTMRRFDRHTLDRAVALVPGVSVSAVGARNETDVWIRGFDRWQVPLYQDGVPIYLPVDDRIDFSRFTTVDLAAVEVSKGFASVIDGPGAMGGEINLVSRIVKRAFEAEGQMGMTLDSTGRYQGWSSDMFVGTRQAHWFIQAAGSFATQSHFRLAGSFAPGTLQGTGDRLDSAHRDYKVDFKAGYLAANGAAYSLNYIDQVARKGNPPIDGTIPPSAMRFVKYWQWPAWDMKSVYWLAQNPIDHRGSYVKTRLYYDRFFNQLDSYDTIAETTQNTPKSFNSTYDDRAAGGSVELDEVLPGQIDTLRGSVIYRADQHNETESTRNAPFAPLYAQPWETAKETTSSVAIEDIFYPGRWRVIAGASYDRRHLIEDNQWVASGIAPPFGYSFAYPIADKHAFNTEFALTRRVGRDGVVKFTYAERSRFPTLFEMYSTRFGTFVNNPALRPERSHYAQAGIGDRWEGTHLSLDVFYARVTDAIVAVPLSPVQSENENVGAERREGYELAVTRHFGTTLAMGISYSDLVREVIAGYAPPTDTPNHKLFGYLAWRPLRGLSIAPSVDIEGRRWLQNAVNNTLYFRGGSFTRIDLKVSYAWARGLRIEAGVKNLADRNYLIEDGYHAPGREYFVSLRAHL